jgi:protein required for attachment to host cells
VRRDLITGRIKMAETKLWLVVADAGRAAFYQADTPKGPLREIQDFIEPDSRLPERELVSDRPGRTFDSAGPGRHAMEPHTPPAEVAAERFARLLADKVDSARQQDRFLHLGLVAPPQFLGLLRKALSEETARRVVLELDKDLTRDTAEELRTHLPERLFQP